MTILTTLYGQTSYRYQIPKTQSDGWQIADFRKLGSDTARLYSLNNQLSQARHKIHSMLLVKDNELVIEEYYNDYHSGKQNDLRSATKSITSILLGIAIDQGYIKSVDDPITKYLESPTPQKNLSPEKEKLTIRHLVTMTTGLDCYDRDKSSKGQEDRVYRKKDWLQYFVDLAIVNPPGEIAEYCTMGQILMVEIIAQSSGMPIDEFARKFLFEPLGISNLSWGHTSNKIVIPSGKRLYMTPRDMAKIGQLILSKGKWNGNQIVSEHWVRFSTASHVKMTGTDYGFLWWIFPIQVEAEQYECIAAMGNGGQYIFIIPDLEAVAVFTGGAFNSPNAKFPYKILRDVLIPSIE